MLKENNLGKGLERKKAVQAQAGGQAEYLPKASPGGEVRALMVCDLSSRWCVVTGSHTHQSERCQFCFLISGGP
eukprot:bmy_11162T0